MRTAPPKMPVFESGRVTLRNADPGLAPRSRAASRWLRSMRSSAAKSGRSRRGRGAQTRGGVTGEAMARSKGWQEEEGDVPEDRGEDAGRGPPAEPVPRLAEHVGEHQEV